MSVVRERHRGRVQEFEIEDSVTISEFVQSVKGIGPKTEEKLRKFKTVGNVRKTYAQEDEEAAVLCIRDIVGNIAYAKLIYDALQQRKSDKNLHSKGYEMTACTSIPEMVRQIKGIGPQTEKKFLRFGTMGNIRKMLSNKTKEECIAQLKDVVGRRDYAELICNAVMGKLESDVHQPCEKGKLHGIQKVLHGHKFQVQVLHLFIVGALSSSRDDFTMTSEKADIKTFDDIYYKTDQRQVFVQVKHSKVMNEPILLKELDENDDFRLLKYFDSFLSIPRKSDGDLFLVCSNRQIGQECLVEALKVVENPLKGAIPVGAECYRPCYKYWKWKCRTMSEITCRNTYFKQFEGFLARYVLDREAGGFRQTFWNAWKYDDEIGSFYRALAIRFARNKRTARHFREGSESNDLKKILAKNATNVRNTFARSKSGLPIFESEDDRVFLANVLIIHTLDVREQISESIPICKKYGNFLNSHVLHNSGRMFKESFVQCITAGCCDDGSSIDEFCKDFVIQFKFISHLKETNDLQITLKETAHIEIPKIDQSNIERFCKQVVYVANMPDEEHLMDIIAQCYKKMACLPARQVAERMSWKIFDGVANGKVFDREVCQRMLLEAEE